MEWAPGPRCWISWKRSWISCTSLSLRSSTLMSSWLARWAAARSSLSLTWSESIPFQGLGLGTELVRRLIQVGRNENIDRIFGDILPQNVEMQRICEKLGFKMTHNVKESLIRAEIEL